MRMRACLPGSLAIWLGFVGPAVADDAMAPIVFPSEGGIVDIQSYGAIPDDEVDDTAAIQAALDAFPNGNRIVYVPPGRYLVSDTLRWPAGSSPGTEHKRTILQGAGESLSIIHLPVATEGFNEVSNPKPVIWTGGPPAQRLRNSIRDLTVEVDVSNPGAIGIQFNASKQGGLRQVTIRSAPGAGRIGLDLGHCDEIGPLYVRGLTVEGFDYGITTKYPVHSNTFEHLLLRGQRRLGWWNYHQMVFIRDLVSENRVPSIYNEKDSWGAVTLLGAHLHAINPDDAPAILNQRQLYHRGLEILGYRRAIEQDDKNRDKGDVIQGGRLDPDTSHRNVKSLFRTGDGTLASFGPVEHLPVSEVPVVAWGEPDKDWVNLLDFGADGTGAVDASPAMQKAIDTGARTIYFPGGATFRFSGTVEIRGPVRRIIGLEGRVVAEGEPVWKFVDGRQPGAAPDAPVVVIERIGGSQASRIRIRHESSRTLLVSSTIGFDVEGLGKGDLHLEDFSGQLLSVAPGQNAWCRQLDSGVAAPCRNSGGRLWILGMSSEAFGTLVDTSAGGVTEINGLYLDSSATRDPNQPAFSVKDATLNLFGVSERNFTRQPVALWVREQQDGDRRELSELPWVYLGR